MPDNVQVTQGSGTTMATDDVAGVQYPRVKLSVGADGAAADVHAGNPLPVTTDEARGAGAVTASTTRVTVASDGPLMTSIGAPADASASSDAGSFSLLAFVKRGLANWTTLLARIPALVSGRVPVDGSGVTQPVSGTVGVSGSVAVTGPVTDAQLRATPVPVSGTVAVTGPLTDAQLRASAVPVSAASLPLPTGAATSAAQSTTNTSLASIDGKLPALVSSRLPVAASIPQAASVTIVTVTTANPGTTFTAFGSQTCTAVDVSNNTGVTIEVQRGGSGNAVQLLSGQARLFVGVTNANQLGVRRVDQSNTTVTVQAEAITV